MHSIRHSALSLVILALASAPLLAQKAPDTKAKDVKKPASTPTVNTGGTTATASEGSTAMAIRGRPQSGRATTIDTRSGVVTAQTNDQHWTVSLRVADRGLLGRVKPGDALTVDLLAGRGSVGGQSCTIVNLTSEIRFTAKFEAEQLCAKTQADMNADAAAAAATGNFSVRWSCSVQEFPGSAPPMYSCICLPVW